MGMDDEVACSFINTKLGSRDLERPPGILTESPSPTSFCHLSSCLSIAVGLEDARARAAGGGANPS